MRTRALIRLINGSPIPLVDPLNPAYVEREYLQSVMHFPEHLAEMVEVEVRIVPKAERDSEVLADGLDDREPGAEVSVMSAGTVSAPEESL